MKLSEQCYVAMIVVGKLATTRWEVARQRHDNKPSPVMAQQQAPASRTVPTTALL